MQITRAMKMVAGARLRRAQERLMTMRPYAQEMASLAFHLLEYVDSVEIPLLSPPNPDAPSAVILFTSDRGLCGAFNSNLVRKTVRYLAGVSSQGKKIKLFVVGRKGFSFMRRYIARNKLANVELSTIPELESSSAFSRFTRVAASLEDSVREGQTSSVTVIYALFHTVVKQDVVIRSLVPLDKEQIHPLMKETPAQQEWDAEREPADTILNKAVFSRFLATQLYRAFIENWTSEMGARMTAMDSATRNAEQLTDTLTLDYNKARQAAITAQIVDITGGAEALRQQ